jgi:hypothetical protein
MITTFAKSLGIEDIEVKAAKLRKTRPNLVGEEAVRRIVRGEFIQPMIAS